MSSTTRRKKHKRKKNAFPLNRPHGIPQPEMFVLKNMDVNSNLLRLKLDMVYRDLAIEEAQKRFGEITITVPETPVEKVEPPKPQRKAVKIIVRKKK
jgi:hypothetical protein